MYDGADDIQIGVVNPTTNIFTPASLQNSLATWGGTGGGTVDVVTITLAPTPTAYATGQRFTFISSGANTGAVTLNVNSLGAKAVKKNGTTALVAGDIPSGAIITVTYDGTNFQLDSFTQASSGFLAIPVGTQTVAATTASKLTFSTEIFDDGANYDAVTNYRYTVPSNGVYAFHVDVSSYSSSASRVISVFLYKNNASYKYSNSSLSIAVAGNNYANNSIDVVDSFVAGDYLEVFLSTTDATVTIDSGGQFTGSKLY